MPDPVIADPMYSETYRTRINQALEHRLSDALKEAPSLHAAMRYSVLGGGKRIRPALCMGAALAVGSDDNRAVVPGCAVELIHAYSLIHDDLPAMDDDELRRGRPTTHIAFDEATAILAGDALQTLAFQWLSEAPGLSVEVRLQMVSELARASGAQGMVGGQAIDLAAVGRTLTLEALEVMHRRKTGALIEASVKLGALTADRLEDAQLSALTRYAQALGLAFQVQDDLLDIEGTTDEIGKPRGSDAARAKPTYPALLGVAGAREHLDTLLDTALQSLRLFGGEADALRTMASFVVSRRY